MHFEFVRTFGSRSARWKLQLRWGLEEELAIIDHNDLRVLLGKPCSLNSAVTQARYIDERQESTRTKQQLTNVKAPLLTQPSSAIEYKCVMSTAVKKPAKTLRQTSRRTRTVSGKNVMVPYKLLSEFKIIILDTAH